jgi:hypothetical protein
MGRKTDVNIELEGFPDIAVTGVQITYGVGMIPTAAIDFAPVAPGGKARVTESSLSNVEQLKREEMSVSVRVKINLKGKQIIRDIGFTGLFDGLTMHNLIGGNSYQAVLKNRAQTLLELTTLTPGLLPASTNVYKIAAFNTVQLDNGGVEKFFQANVGIQENPIKYYTELLKWIVKNQKEGFDAYIGTDDELPGGKKPFKDIFNDARYKKSLDNALEILGSIDLSAVDSGKIAATSLTSAEIVSRMQSIFLSGPDNILENYLYFLNNFGCTLIFSNSKMFVVPANSVLKPEKQSPQPKELQTEPNRAGPADYNNYTYSDVGYKDLSSVIVVPDDYTGGSDKGNRIPERGMLGQYVDEQNLSKSGGVLVVTESIWARYSPLSTSEIDSITARTDLENNKDVFEKPNSDDSSQEAKEAQVTAAQEKVKKYNKLLSQVADNYAKIKFYQEKYRDRTGSLLMDFNPNWVPGTTGTLYVRETGLTIAFYVTQVTHTISNSAPDSGSAVTSVSFCCGRIGAPPAGIEEYLYLGYNLSKEKQIQNSFIGDNKQAD